jgi:hypothetical protein
MAGRGRAKSRDDITSLTHVIYCGEDSMLAELLCCLTNGLFSTGIDKRHRSRSSSLYLHSNSKAPGLFPAAVWPLD